VPVLHSLSKSELFGRSRSGIDHPHLPFLFGCSVYPELQKREESSRMLDLLQSAQMNVVRVGESSWGNLETAPGKFNFGWLRDFLDEIERRKMMAILGTATYIPPQWLVGAHPEITVQLLPGLSVDPMARKSPCLNHPLYREACRRYVGALGKEFADHPAVLAWQLDNEIEYLVPVICYNPACERAWRQWLENTYHTPQELNQRLNLVSWGMKVDSFDEVPQPRPSVEGQEDHISLPGDARQLLPALSLANLHFERDVILDFLAEQAGILRGAGVRQWIMTDWVEVWPALADDSKSQAFISMSGLNYYQPSSDDKQFWSDSPWHFDMHRSAYGTGKFIVTETSFGAPGQTAMWDVAPTREQFRMWNLELAAFGASGLLYWTGNRWRGGHWPQWGGLLDWSGQPEPDFPWAVEAGEFFRKWGTVLLANPVKATAVALTDFDERAALQVYPHVPSSLSVLPESFAAFHRLGIGIDTMNTTAAETVTNLQKYSLVLIPAAPAFDNPRAVAALRQFVAGGGTLLITPFTAYMDRDGVFRGDGFGANLVELTGCLVRTVRWIGSPSKGGREEPEVTWSDATLNRTSPVGLDGYCEYLELAREAEVIAAFRSDQEILDGRPAATRRRLGQGTVIKLGFWPKDDSFLALVQSLTAPGLLGAPCPEGVLAVPRTDNSLFVINATAKPQTVAINRSAADRLSGKRVSTKLTMTGYEVLWLE
jgi:beta-galactosidase